jgi:cytoskeletal protein RodZ
MKYRKSIARTLQSQSIPNGLRRASPNGVRSHGHGDCCARCPGRSSLGLRPTDAPWQTNVSRTTRSIGSPSNLAPWVAPGVVPAAWARSGLLKATLVAAAVAAAVLAATPAAHAQDAPAAGQSASAPAATPGSTASSDPSSSAPASTTSSTPPPATAGQAPAGQSTGSKTDPVCFKLTGHCVDSSKATAKAGTAGSTKAGSTTGKKPLNLTAPDVRTVVPESELKEPLPNTEQITETQEADTVSVKGDQGVPPDVPVGFGAIWWALNHPSQSWRIFTPDE